MNDDTIIHEATIPKLMTITPQGKIEVEGEQFPFVVIEEKVRIEVDPQGIHVVYLPVVVERIEINTVLAPDA